jgi:hypothetical protein
VRDLYGHLNESAYFEDALLDVHRQPHWDALVEIMELKYWQRIWVVQEINSSRSLILRCGSDTAKWEHFTDVQNKLVAMHYRCGERWKNFRDGGPRIVRLPSSDPSMPAPPGLLEALNFFRFHSATDPRDMVYAIVGLTEARDDPQMPIDYSQSVRQVYINVVDYVLSRDRKLDVICAGVPKENIYHLPSWTPSWNQSWRFTSVMLPTDKPAFSASLARPAEATILKEQDILRARGFRVDSVRTLGGPIATTSTRDLGPMVATILRWYTISFLYETEGHNEAFVRTMICDRVRGAIYSQEVIKMVLGMFPRLARKIVPSEPIPTLLQSLPDASVAPDMCATLGCVLFATVYWADNILSLTKVRWDYVLRFIKMVTLLLFS